MMPSAPFTTIEFLLQRYPLLLLDAYGVLLDDKGTLPGAIELVEQLNRTDHAFRVVTNSASRLPEVFADELHRLGLPIPPERIITSGGILTRYFAAHGLSGSRTIVLGPDNSMELVRRAGGRVVHWSEEAEVIVIADQAGFPLLEGLNGVVTQLLRRLDRGDSVELLLCNPDLIYPTAGNSYGVTAGGLAHLIEGILQERYPESGHRFTRLGKPHAPLFTTAIGEWAKEHAIMIGDQLATDIAGAQRIGIDSALVMSGLARVGHHSQPQPTYILPSLIPRAAG